MTPRCYFEKHFKNIQKTGKEQFEQDGLLESLYSYEDVKSLLDAENFTYSNNMEYEMLIKKFCGTTIDMPDRRLYIGKIVNAYPNCYRVNHTEIDGCLVCITSGMTENTYVFSKYYVLLYEQHGLKNEMYEMYKLVLENDIRIRIKEGYGKEIPPGNLLYYADYIISKSNASFLSMAAAFSFVMDLFLILHEYAHYLVNAVEDNKNITPKMIFSILQAKDLCFHLQEEDSVFADMPQEEIMADMLALQLMAGNEGLGMNDTMAILLSIVQLKQMSPEDVYTNCYRIKVFYFYFSRCSQFFCDNEAEIRKRVQTFCEFFDYIANSGFNEDKLTQDSWNVIENYILALDNGEDFMDIATFMVNDRIKGLQRIENFLRKKEGNDTDVYEEFL